MVCEQTETIRIGDLLVRAGVVTPADCSEAEKLSAHMKIQFGRLLVMSGCVTESSLACALEAQSMINRGLLDAGVAVETLAYAVEDGISFAEALEQLDILPQFGTSTSKLADLIREANIIDEALLQRAIDRCMQENIPLSNVLIMERCLPSSFMILLEKTQDEIRRGTLVRESSIAAFRHTFTSWQKAQAARNNDPLSKSAVRALADTQAQSEGMTGGTAASPSFNLGSQISLPAAAPDDEARIGQLLDVFASSLPPVPLAPDVPVESTAPSKVEAAAKVEAPVAVKVANKVKLAADDKSQLADKEKDAVQKWIEKTKLKVSSQPETIARETASGKSNKKPNDSRREESLQLNEAPNSVPEPDQQKRNTKKSRVRVSERQAVSQLDDLDFIGLLDQSGVISAAALQAKIISSLNDRAVACKIMHLISALDGSIIDAGARAHELVHLGTITLAQAKSTLAKICQGKLKPTELEVDLGLKKPKTAKGKRSIK